MHVGVCPHLVDWPSTTPADQADVVVADNSQVLYIGGIEPDRSMYVSVSDAEMPLAMAFAPSSDTPQRTKDIDASLPIVRMK